jgi:hypothetical protein
MHLEEYSKSRHFFFPNLGLKHSMDHSGPVGFDPASGKPSYGPCSVKSPKPKPLPAAGRAQPNRPHVRPTDPVQTRTSPEPATSPAAAAAFASPAVVDGLHHLHFWRRRRRRRAAVAHGAAHPPRRVPRVAVPHGAARAPPPGPPLPGLALARRVRRRALPSRGACGS